MALGVDLWTLGSGCPGSKSQLQGSRVGRSSPLLSEPCFPGLEKGDDKRSFPWAVVKLKHDDDDGRAPNEGTERLSYTC